MKFSILDRGDQEAAARTALREVKVQSAAMKPSDLLAKISRWKTAGLSPSEATGAVEDDKDFLAAVAYRRYAEKLRSEGGVDFDDLLLLTLDLFRRFPDRLAVHAGRFDFVQVDEYQDTNGVQFKLLKALVWKHKNLCVVGDDDQSIYGWRGAEVEHILNFTRHFPGATVVRLEANYRCAAPVLEWSNRLVTFNKDRHAKTLVPARRVTNPVVVRPFQDEQVEAEQTVLELDFPDETAGREPRRRGDPAPHRRADPAVRGAPGGNGRSPMRSWAGSRSSTARRSRTCWRCCGRWSPRATTGPSSASSTSRPAASVRRR